MSNGVFLGGLIAGFLLLGQPGVAAAQTSEVTEAEADKLAREHFLLGDRHYSEGDYERAIDEFQRAYDLSGRPELHYNLANAYERLGRYEQALRSLTLYEPHAPTSRKAVVEKRIKALQARVHPTAPAQESGAAPPVEDPGAADSGSGADSDGGETPYLGYGLLGLSAVGLGAGLFFALDASSARSDAEAACPSSAGGRFCTADAQEFLDRDQRSSVLADIGFGVGLVSAVVGLYLVLDAGPASAPADTTARAPKETGWPQPGLRVGPRGGEVTLVGRF